MRIARPGEHAYRVTREVGQVEFPEVSNAEPVVNPPEPLLSVSSNVPLEFRCSTLPLAVEANISPTANVADWAGAGKLRRASRSAATTPTCAFPEKTIRISFTAMRVGFTVSTASLRDLAAKAETRQGDNTRPDAGVVNN